jgi:hypothetical protein
MSIHDQASMISENYEWLAESYPIEGLSVDMEPATEIEWTGSDAWKKLGSPIEGQGDINRCDHCNQKIRYQIILLHVPTGDILSIGHQCYENRFNVPGWKRNIQAAQNAAKRRVEKARNRAAILPLFSAAAVIDWALAGSVYIAQDIVRNGLQYGKLSPKQAALVERLYAESQKAPELEPETADVIEGRIEITGVVLGFKWVDNPFRYGDAQTQKMIVRDDRGFKVFGTVPNRIDGIDGYSVLAKGQRIQFTAQVERSGDDSTFGFFKRPASAKVA